MNILDFSEEVREFKSFIKMKGSLEISFTLPDPESSELAEVSARH